MKKITIKVYVICILFFFALTSLIPSIIGLSILKPIDMKLEDNVIGTGVIQGVIRKYPEGTPLSSADVECRKSVSLPWKSVTSNENGEYRFDIRNLIMGPKTYVLWADKAGYEMLPTYIDVDNPLNVDVTKDLWLAIPFSGRIHGYITDEKDNPLTSTRVELLAYPYSDVYEVFNTTSEGYYYFTSLGVDYYKIFVEKIGYRQPYKGPIELHLGSDGQFDIEYNYYLVKSRIKFLEWEEVVMAQFPFLFSFLNKIYN
jgi:hypothetical protein